MSRSAIPRGGATALLAALSLSLSAALSGCVSPQVESRLQKLEVKQDSLIRMIATMKEQSEFVAMRVGWRPPRDTVPQDIPVGSSPVQGRPDAAVTLVEFSDLECPYCAQVAPVLDSVAKAYPQDVRVVFKHFPLSFHPKARAAAAAALAAGNQGKFFEFRYRVAPHFRALGDSLYLAVAQELKLDLARFKKEMALSPEVNRILDADLELGRKVGVEGTPTIFVNGHLAEERSFDYFARQVAKAKSKSG
jgi:protein-disulfide isomerase